MKPNNAIQSDPRRNRLTAAAGRDFACHQNRALFIAKSWWPIVDLLRQGITPEKIALSIALGIVLGVFPVLGSTTILCAVAALLLKLNIPAIQLVNYFVYPVQLILFLPFLHAGNRIVGGRNFTLSMPEIFAMLKSEPLALIRMLWVASLGAMALWLILSPAAIAVIYYALAPVLRRLGKNVAETPN